MIEIASLRCNNCGGSLVHQNDNIWLCESCGKFSIVNITADAMTSSVNSKKDSTDKIAFKLSIKCANIEKIFTCPNNSSLKFTYKKRATMADPYPSTIQLELEDESILALSDAPRFDYSKLNISTDLSKIIIRCNKKGILENTITAELGKEVFVNGIYLKISL